MIIEASTNKKFNWMCEAYPVDNLELCKRLSEIDRRRLTLYGDVGSYVIQFIWCDEYLDLNEAEIFLDRFINNGESIFYSDSREALERFIGAKHITNQL